MATDQNFELQTNMPIPQARARRRSDFVSITKLTDLKDLILRGAYIAEDPDNFSNVEGLTESDREALKRESEEIGPFKMLARVPKQLRTIIITCSVAAITQFVQPIEHCIMAY
jgi:hypothetical protein